jgi:archaellum component FlaD/FlaE
MSLSYLPEYAENARMALELAKKEMAHLAYTQTTLFAQTINLQWVQSLSEREDLSEKIDAFVGRFGRLQDHIGEKLIPRFAALLGESPKSLLDVLAYAEKIGWLSNTETFIEARKLRNLLIHEYMTDAELFLESLRAADEATQLLIDVVVNIDRHADAIGLNDYSLINSKAKNLKASHNETNKTII